MKPRRTALAALRLVAAALGLFLTACSVPSSSGERSVLRLATTTSTYDSGLLDAILPDFEASYNARVDVVAVGTGQAITLGQNGDADLILVHSRAREEQFVAGGYGTERSEVMFNDFVLVGPSSDPAGVSGQASAAEALARIAAAGARFASRGDDSGTHAKERSIWQAAGLQPTSDQRWYFVLGQGMGETLQFANEQNAYTLSDRGTFLALGDGLAGLAILFGGDSIEQNPDPQLYNSYGLIPVDPERHPGIQAELAQRFVEWLTSLETQEAIAEYGVDRFGQPLFYPNSETYQQAYP